MLLNVVLFFFSVRVRSTTEGYVSALCVCSLPEGGYPSLFQNTSTGPRSIPMGGGGYPNPVSDVEGGGMGREYSIQDWMAVPPVHIWMEYPNPGLDKGTSCPGLEGVPPFPTGWLYLGGMPLAVYRMRTFLFLITPTYLPIILGDGGSTAVLPRCYRGGLTIAKYDHRIGFRTSRIGDANPYGGDKNLLF